MLNVSLDFPKGDRYSEASVNKIFDDNFGLIDLKGQSNGTPFRFFTLFHKDQVSIKLIII